MWKIYIYILIMVMGVTLLNSCAKEDPIKSKFEVKFGSFDFPQGTNSWDNEIKKIKEQYGVSVIYKDITEADMTRSWTGGTGTIIPKADQIPEAELDDAVAMLRDRILQYIPPKMAKAILPPYIFLVTNYTDSDPIYRMLNGLGYSMNGLDHWVVSTKWKFNLFDRYVHDYAFNRDFAADMLYNVYITKAKPKGAIKIPEEFNDKMDFTTQLDTNNGPESPNYFLNRGFVHSVYLDLMISGQFIFNEPYNISNAKADDFKSYLYAIMIYSKTELKEVYPPDKYPLINTRLNVIYKMWDDIGLDMRQGILK